MPYVSANDVELYYELTGTGDPLVLVHAAGLTTATGRPSPPRWLKPSSWSPTTAAVTARVSEAIRERGGIRKMTSPA